MKIKRVKLCNYAQHSNLDIKIESDFVGIVGENGSGKSNFINAISDAITGDFHKKKSLILTHGQKKGSITIEGSFSQNEEFVLQKSLSGTETTLTINNEPLVGADIVSAKILELTDCDKSFMSNMVFVKQEDILGILFGRPAERNKLLQRFFGLEKAQKIDMALSSWASTVPETVEVNESAVKEEIKETEAALLAHQLEKDSLSAELFELKESLDQDKSLIKKAEDLYQRAKNYESARSQIEKFELEKAEIKGLLKALKKPKSNEEEIGKMLEKISEMKEKIASLSQLKELLEDSMKIVDANQCDQESCALCGSKLDDQAKNKIEEKIESIKASIEKEKDKKSIVFAEYKSASDELHAYSDQLQRIERRSAFIESQLEALSIVCEGSPPKAKAEVYKKAIDDYQESKLQASTMQAKVEAIENTISVCNGTLTRCKNALLAAERTRKENDAIRKHKQRVSRLQSLFKYNGSATEVYVNTKMKKMCACINSYLLGFGSPYRVKVDKNNEFICQFPNKTILSGELSGGQKVILSLAFRFAACELFTSKTNLIVLDEPTTWLDQKRIDSFGDILSKVKAMSQEKNLQVFIVTHEKSLIPNFDQVIEF